MSAAGLDASVIVVGAGPVGLTLANALGQARINTIVIDREEGTVAEARAVSIDDEALRVMQALGLGPEILKDVVPGYGSHYYTGPGGRQFARVEPTVSDYGYPRRNAFRQPLFEAALLKGLERFACVRVLFGHNLESLEQDAAGVSAHVSAPGGARLVLRASWLAACDGGRSTVRKLLGIAMSGSSFRARWLVLDTEQDNDPYKHSRVYCNAARAVLDIPGPHRTRRFEFLLKDGEDEEAVMAPARVRELLQPFRGAQPTAIVRKIVYTFHARMAEKWRVGRVFLAGDAAHLTPPYAGQGLNSGVRDAHNLGWKLAAACRGQFADKALDSYEAERRDHAWSLIKLALNLGVVMAPKNRLHAAAVVWFFTLAGLFPPLRDYFLQMRFKPKPRFAHGLIVDESGGLEASMVGRMLPQPLLRSADGRSQLMDELIGPGFALIATEADAEAELAALSHPLWDELGAVRLLIVSPGDATGGAYDGPNYRRVIDTAHGMGALRGSLLGKFILLRPDRYVAGVFHGAEEATFADRFRRLLDGHSGKTRH
jgi:3-(3-hydroxy-phenyl)propionate hydroxylase